MIEGPKTSYQYVCYQSSESNIRQDIIKIPQLKQDNKKQDANAAPSGGVSKIEWSYTGHFMVSKSDAMPKAVWIWDMTTLELATVLIHKNNVKNFKFNPNSNELYIVAGAGRVYTWGPLGASVVELPIGGEQTVALNKIIWNPNSGNLLLMDKVNLMIGIPPSE
jgi:WD40 repeat protein